MVAYYNEHDAFAAAWLRNLIAAGHIAPGVVDERDIRDVRPSDLDGFVQCHFFAGIGVWSYALRLAGWPDDRPIWTGSCPCQPFSAAGRGAGFADERHLWPSWFWLISQCRPSIVGGEQVASGPAGAWLDLVCSDLEGLGYACGAVPFPAASVGAPNIRDRSYWVAHADGAGPLTRRQAAPPLGYRHPALADGGPCWLADTANGGRLGRRCRVESHGGAASRFESERFCDAGFWTDADWITCRDGKARPVEPGTFPLAHGAPARVGRLRAYGNAINAEAAAAFIHAADGALLEAECVRLGGVFA